MSINYPVKDVHTLTIEEAVENFQTDAKQGLNEPEAAKRRREADAAYRAAKRSIETEEEKEIRNQKDKEAQSRRRELLQLDRVAKENRLAQERESRRRQRALLPDDYQDWNTNPSTALRYLSLISGSRNAYSDMSESDIESLLQPITEEEKVAMVNDFRSHMDPHTTMYGCACCGIRVLPFGEEVRNSFCTSFGQEGKDLNFQNLILIYVYC